LEEDYSIRKDLIPENFKDEKSIEKVIDQGAKRILLSRFREFGNDPKKAFSDLDKNPIWLNREKGISIKRVTISGVKNTEALHFKKDHFGSKILNSEGKRIPVDYVSTGNNHHVAVYKDEKDQLQVKVISFFEALERVNQGLPVVDKIYNKKLIWQFLFTMKQNEYFVFPNKSSFFDPNEIELLDPKNKKLISPNLFLISLPRKMFSAIERYWLRASSWWMMTMPSASLSRILANFFT
jgi:CRISPR-associated endonuclease Csn1